MSELSKRITQTVETQGRLQSAAAQYAASVTSRRAETATRVAGVGEVELMRAWLEGYVARVGDELATAKTELAMAEHEHTRHALRNDGTILAGGGKLPSVIR